MGATALSVPGNAESAYFFGNSFAISVVEQGRKRHARGWFVIARTSSASSIIPHRAPGRPCTLARAIRAEISCTNLHSASESRLRVYRRGMPVGRLCLFCDARVRSFMVYSAAVASQAPRVVACQILNRKTWIAWCRTHHHQSSAASRNHASAEIPWLAKLRGTDIVRFWSTEYPRLPWKVERRYSGH